MADITASAPDAVAQIVGHVAATATAATGTAVPEPAVPEPVAGALPSVTEPAAAAVTAITEPAAGALAGATSTADTLAQPLAGAVAKLAAPVTGGAGAPVQEPAHASAEAVVTTGHHVARALEQAPPSEAADAIAPGLGRAVDEVVHPVAHTTGSLADTTGMVLHTVAGPTGGPPPALAWDPATAVADAWHLLPDPAVVAPAAALAIIGARVLAAGGGPAAYALHAQLALDGVSTLPSLARDAAERGARALAAPFARAGGALLYGDFKPVWPRAGRQDGDVWLVARIGAALGAVYTGVWLLFARRPRSGGG